MTIKIKIFFFNLAPASNGEQSTDDDSTKNQSEVTILEEFLSS